MRGRLYHQVSLSSTLDDVEMRKEPYDFDFLMQGCVASHVTILAAKAIHFPGHTLDEAIASKHDPIVVRKVKDTEERKASTRPKEPFFLASTDATDFGPEPSFDRPATLEYRSNIKHCSIVISFISEATFVLSATSEDFDWYYEAKLTYRGKIVVATKILGRLTKNQLALFRTTCFGSWLDVQHTGGDPQLTHLILQTQVFHDPPTPDEMWFDIGGHKIRFSRKEFCLVTGLRFGSDSHILPWVAGMSNNPFKDRMFPNIPSGQLVKLSDIVTIFDDMHPSVPMDDHDAVRICLLMLLHMGFLGRQPINIVRDELLMLVEDLDSWNLFPWGSYVWQFTFPQLSKAITQHHDSHAAPRPQGKLIKYTLTGFIWAFKIWILEAFPFALSNFQRDVGLIPRAISWRRIHPFSWEKCLNFVVVDERRPPLRTLTPTDAERQTKWWKASAKYFAGVDDQRQRPVKNKKARSPSPSRPAKKARSPSPPPSSQVQDTCNLDHVPSAFDGVDACGMPTLDTTTTPYKDDTYLNVYS
ncbi:phospholipase-like protein [Tanacetum coccineum]